MEERTSLQSPLRPRSVVVEAEIGLSFLRPVRELAARAFKGDGKFSGEFVWLLALGLRDGLYKPELNPTEAEESALLWKPCFECSVFL